MKFGDIFNIFESNTGVAGQSSIKKPNAASSILKTLSRYGMNYDDDVYKNMIAIPADKSLIPQSEQVTQSLYSGLMNGNYRVKGEEEKSFADKSFDQKISTLRKLAAQPEIEDILDVMSNEAIVYEGDEVYICRPFIDNAVVQDLNEDSINELNTATNSIFYKIYLLLNFKQDAWNVFRRWLVDGVLAYEIVYDNINNPHTIIGIAALNPATLTKKIENGVTYWIQYKDVMGMERRLTDAQIIYIKYEDSGVIERQSYLERLIRPFNIYRIVEQAQIIWTVTQSSFKTMFTIPVSGMNKAKGLQTLNAAMNRYKEDITFNSETGEIKVNGKTNMPFNKEFWMPENENGTPQIETLTDNGPSLNDSEQLRFFEAKLYKMSKIPASRFDVEQQSTWFGADPSQTLREEINFGRFVNRLRSTFAELILKPLRIQLALQMPNLKNDRRVLDSIGLRYSSYNQFTELMKNEIDIKRIEYIQNLKDTFMDINSEGDEIPFFCNKFLVTKYLKMTDADLELNEKYKNEEKMAAKLKEREEEEANELPDDVPDEVRDELDDESNDQNIDKEMMGDVQPESEETTRA